MQCARLWPHAAHRASLGAARTAASMSFGTSTNLTSSAAPRTAMQHAQRAARAAIVVRTVLEVRGVSELVAGAGTQFHRLACNFVSPATAVRSLRDALSVVPESRGVTSHPACGATQRCMLPILERLPHRCEVAGPGPVCSRMCAAAERAAAAPGLPSQKSEKQ